MEFNEGGEAEATLDAVDDQRLGALLRQLTGGVIVMMVLIGALAMVAQEPVELASAWFVERFGLWGVFLGVLVVDTTVFTNEPLLFMAWQGGLGFWSVFVVASIASVVAGPLGWLYGRVLGRSAWVQAAIRRRRIDVFLHRYGFWAVTVAALTPIPFSLSTWASGASGVPLAPVLLGSLFRIPKTLFYFVVMVFGWDLFAD
jgi:membrane protein YqaA with SNARE-associated domain